MKLPLLLGQAGAVLCTLGWKRDRACRCYSKGKQLGWGTGQWGQMWNRGDGEGDLKGAGGGGRVEAMGRGDFQELPALPATLYSIPR